MAWTIVICWQTFDAVLCRSVSNGIRMKAVGSEGVYVLSCDLVAQFSI